MFLILVKIIQIYNFFSLQYSCLENSMDRGAWLPTAYGEHEWSTNTFIFPTRKAPSPNDWTTRELPPQNIFHCDKIIHINIKFTILAIFQVYSSVVLSTFTLLCNQFPGHSSSCKTKIPYPLNNSSLAPPPAPGNHPSSLSLWSWPLQEPHINGIIHCLFVTGLFHLT